MEVGCWLVVGVYCSVGRYGYLVLRYWDVGLCLVSRFPRIREAGVICLYMLAMEININSRILLSITHKASSGSRK